MILADELLSSPPFTLFDVCCVIVRFDMSLLSPTEKEIRKLRKKLRQIEHLEFLGRASLNEEELLKVKKTCPTY